MKKELYNHGPMLAGDLEVIFHNVPSPEIFVSKTFIPFMEMNKTDLSKCGFVVASHMVNHKTDIKVNFFALKPDFDLLRFKKRLIANVSELSLYMISVNQPCSGETIPEDSLRVLQEISEQAVLLYSSGNDLDGLVRMTLKYYFDVLADNTRSMDEFRVVNRYVLEDLLPESLSSITAEFLLLCDVCDGVEKVRREYMAQFNENRACFFDEVRHLLEAVRMPEINATPLNEDVSKKADLVRSLYHAVFSASMMHPYYLAFIPFSINEVLKYEI